MLHPLTFRPIFKERVWGGRKLEELYQKPLPPGATIGESWEISDRPGDVSVIANGPLGGKDLHWLVQHHQAELLGSVKPQSQRFPLLVKILDAQDKLSLQVHPPPDRAAELGGEPKTEMWYIAHAEPNAELFVGLRRGVTKEAFQAHVSDGTVASCFHRISVRAGDAMFLPSGRVHAIGAGIIIFEIQQNSDTTYRVFDWNRVGLDGKPRSLHVAESLESIDFGDFEPGLVRPEIIQNGPVKRSLLVRDSAFIVELVESQTNDKVSLPDARMQILAVLSGHLEVSGGGSRLKLGPGQFVLLPASLTQASAQSIGAARFLRVEVPEKLHHG